MKYDKPENIKALIFDFDGTIVDSMPIHFLSWKQAFASFGAAFSEKFFYDNAGVSLIGVVEKFNRDNGTMLPPSEVVAQKDAAHVAYLPETKPISQVVEIIEKYHGILPMAVATGNSKNLTAPLMKSLHLSHFFDAVIYGDDVANPKPHPDCFLMAAAQIGIDPQWCEVFEDGDVGIEGARRAGMKVTDIRPWL